MTYMWTLNTMHEKYRAVKVSRSLQMTLSVIAEHQLIFQFSMEKQYPNRVYQIETFFSEENWLIFVEFKGKDTWEAAVFPATAWVNTGYQPLATVATKKPHFGENVAIFAISLWTLCKCSLLIIITTCITCKKNWNKYSLSYYDIHNTHNDMRG